MNGSASGTPSAEVSPAPSVNVYSVARSNGSAGVKTSVVSSTQAASPGTSGVTVTSGAASWAIG